MRTTSCFCLLSPFLHFSLSCFLFSVVVVSSHLTPIFLILATGSWNLSLLCSALILSQFVEPFSCRDNLHSSWYYYCYL